MPEGRGCHGSVGAQRGAPRSLRVALVGAPNVGKSALFNRLTGRYVVVSNYPGTTVESVRGRGVVEGRPADIIDTPGMHSLLPTSEDERVARRMLLDGGADVVVHVVDAKNLSRMLPITLQLLEVGRPLVIALNMMDEAERLGLCIPQLRAAIAAAGSGRAPVPAPPVYGNGVGTALRMLRERLRGVYPVDPAV